MDELHQWLGKQLDEKKVEPNSSLGKAINYMLNHWQPLTLFLRVEKAPLGIISESGHLRWLFYIETMHSFIKPRMGHISAICS